MLPKSAIRRPFWRVVSVSGDAYQRDNRDCLPPEPLSFMLCIFFESRIAPGRGADVGGSLIPVWLAPDIPFTRPWAAMPPTSAPQTTH